MCCGHRSPSDWSPSWLFLKETYLYLNWCCVNINVVAKKGFNFIITFKLLHLISNRAETWFLIIKILFICNIIQLNIIDNIYSSGWKVEKKWVGDDVIFVKMRAIWSTKKYVTYSWMMGSCCYYPLWREKEQREKNKMISLQNVTFLHPSGLIIKYFSYVRLYWIMSCIT